MNYYSYAMICSDEVELTYMCLSVQYLIMHAIPVDQYNST